MPKLKTHKGLHRRIKLTGGGRIKHRRRGTSHLNSGIPGSRRRKLHQDVIVHAATARKLQGALHTRVTGPRKS